MDEANAHMTSRWIAAGAAACAVALLTVPWMLRSPRTSPAVPIDHVSEPPAAPAMPGDEASAVKGAAAKLDLTVKDMNGASVRLADYKGKIIVLNFWATWCGPCQAEIPELVRTSAEYKDKGVVVLGISIDDTAETLRAYAPQKKMNYPVLLMQDDVDQAYGPIFGVPVTFFIGRDGTINRKHFGPVTKEQVDQEIKALL
jgi:cytochrome c biogenesis protein CcmG, thiol:disulfide interchange protein DsbE